MAPVGLTMRVRERDRDRERARQPATFVVGNEHG
jgi:hypothetical protein